MRVAALLAMLFLTGCMPGCGGETVETPTTHAGAARAPVRLPSGAGEDEEAVAAPSEDFAEPPPVEPPPIASPSE